MHLPMLGIRGPIHKYPRELKKINNNSNLLFFLLKHYVFNGKAGAGT